MTVCPLLSACTGDSTTDSTGSTSGEASGSQCSESTSPAPNSTKDSVGDSSVPEDSSTADSSAPEDSSTEDSSVPEDSSTADSTETTDSSTAEETVKITFNLNGGDLIEGELTVTVKRGEKLSIVRTPDVDMNGYVFIYWAYDKNGEYEWTNADRFYVDTVLFAIWWFEGGVDSSVTQDTSTPDSPDTTDSSVTDDTSIDSDTTDSSNTVDSTEPENKGPLYFDDEGFELNEDGEIPTVSKAVSNATKNIDLKKAIHASDEFTWKLYRDYEGESELKLKTMTLSVGENKAYIVLFDSQNEPVLMYEVRVYRLDMVDYTVIVDGMEIDSQTVEERTSLNFFDFPEKTGYTFEGWAVDGEIVSFPYVIETDTEFEAVFEAITYTITYESNSGMLDGESCKEYTIEDSVTLKNPQREYYTFGGWYNNSSLTGDVITQISAGSYGDKAFYAKWVPIIYKIEYDVNGGVNDSENVDIYTAEDEFAFKDPSKEGYTFVGWYSDKELTAKVEGISKGQGGNVKLFAKWKENENTIVFMSQTGGGTMDNMVVLSNTTVNLALNTYVKPGYTFRGWATRKGGSVTYKDGAEFTVGTQSTYTLYAVWKANENTLIYDANGADGTMDNEIVETDGKLSLATVAFTKPGYIFVGWATAPDGDALYDDGAEYVMGTESTYTLYAVWEKSLNSVKFDSNGGEGDMESLSATTHSTIQLTENTFTREGYTFIGWSSTPDGEVEYVNGAEYVIGVDKLYTLYAVWEINVYTVTYKDNCGAWEDEKTFTIKDLPFATPELENKENLLFNYWYKESNYSGNPVLEIAEIGNIILYAEYIECTDGIELSETDGVYNVTGYTGDAGDVVIPKLYKGKPVTSIGSSAFSGCTSLTSVAIPESVASIGSYAFKSCSALKGVNYLGTIEQWCNIAFGNTYANPLYYAKNLYFGGELVTKLVIPNTVTQIKRYTFYNCTSLTSVEIGENVATIGDSAFSMCTKLTEIKFKATAMEDFSSSNKEYVFSGAGIDAKVTVAGNVTKIPAHLFRSSKVTSIVFEAVGACTSIGDYAFSGCSGLTSITIPNSVTSIGDYAFSGCSGLTSMIVPNGITSISNGMFYGCSSLTNITIPNSITTIGDYAFRECVRLQSINMSSSVTTIGEYAFADCDWLQGITLPNGLTAISNGMFYDCYNLLKISIPSSVTIIGDYAFCNSRLTSISISSGVTAIGVEAFGSCDNLTSITIPGNVKTIGDGAFRVCSGLKSVTICEGVETIGKNAFASCYESLTSVTIANSVTSIGIGAFQYCSSLTSITLPFVGATLNGTSNVHFGYIFGASSYSENSTCVPTSLTKVTITGCEAIGERAFWGCSKLTNITMPDGLVTVNDYAFYNCSSLTSITVPNSVTTIGSYAFKYCERLTGITIPNSVTSLGGYVFDNCPSPTIYCEAASKPSTWNANWNYYNAPVVWDCNNNNVAADGKVYVIIDGLKYALAGDTATVAKQHRYVYSAVIPKNVSYNGKEYRVTAISQEAFYNSATLTNITIPDSVMSIGANAFYNCSKLKAVYITDMTAWCNISFSNEYSNPLCYGKNLYLNNSLVKSVTIPAGMTAIGAYTFVNCSNITELTIASTVTTIGDSAFKGTSITKLTIPSKVSSIGRYAFSGCSGITSLSVPNTVSSIGEGAFKDCTGLTSVTVSTTTIPNSMFMNCSALTSLTISSRVITIETQAFYNCSSLTKVTIPNSVTTIQNNAFRGCTSVTSLSIGSSVSSIGDYAFCDCTGVEELFIPSSVTSMGTKAVCAKRYFISASKESAANWSSGWNGGSGSAAYWNIYKYGTSQGCLWVAYNSDKSSAIISKFSGTATSISLATITMPSGTSITEISGNAFANSGITSITMPSSLKVIGTNAFKDCTSLETVTLQGNVRVLDHAFYGCTALKSIDFSKITYIDEYAFYNCDGLTTLVLSSYIGAYAFYGCDGATSIHLTKTVTKVMGYAFYNCSSVTSIVIDEGVTSLGTYAFAWCEKVSHIIIPYSVTFIDSYLAYGCEELWFWCRSTKSYALDYLGWTLNWNVSIIRGLNSSRNNVHWGYTGT